MVSLRISLCTLLCFFAGTVFAAPITYQLSVNTSAIAGTVGSLDFNFNPGPLTTQAASVQILGFLSNGSLVGSTTRTGDISGSLPATLTFDNGTGYNDYFQDFKYGSTLSFDVSLYGPALSSPNGTATSGSTFAFSLFSDAAGTNPVLTSNLTDGFAYTINVNLDGSTNATNYSSQLNASIPSQVPEPNSLTLAGTGILLLIGLSAYAGRLWSPGLGRCMRASVVILFMGVAVVQAQQPQRPLFDITGAPIRKHLPYESTRPQVHTNATQSSASNNAPPAGAILDLNGTPVPGGGNTTYQMYTATFSASLPNTAITFAFREDPAFLYFSNPSVVDTTTGSGNLLTNANFSGAVYTSNGNSATPVGWTYANVYGATFGGVIAGGCGVGPTGNYGVGNCWYDGAVQAYDALTQTIATTAGHQYKITFYLADDSGCSIDGGAPCNFSELSTNGDTTDTGGNGINVTVYDGAALPAPAAIQFRAGIDPAFLPNNPADSLIAMASAEDVSANAVDMQSAATKVGFDHFNWLQFITSSNIPAVCANEATCAFTTLAGTSPATTVDPPLGGWAYEYWDTVDATYNLLGLVPCPGPFCPSFTSPIQDYWLMYWDEYFGQGQTVTVGGVPYTPYIANSSSPEYASKYRVGNGLYNQARAASPGQSYGYAFSDEPSGVIASFVTALVGVTGDCNILVSSNCAFQIFPGTTFKWTSTNGVISAYTPTPGPLARPATASSAVMSWPSSKKADDFPANPRELTGAELASSIISIDQFLSLANLTRESLAAMGGGISIFSGSLVPSQAAALAAVQAGGILVPPAQLTATASGLAYSRVSRTFNGTVTLTNTSSGSLSGPFQILFDGLPTGVTLVNSTGSLATTPYLTMSTVSLASGQSVTIGVQFRNPENSIISVSPSVYSGVLH